MIQKPFAESCVRNQQVILDALKGIIKPTDKHLLEIGSGTGQHAVFMAPFFPLMQWHTADLPENHEGIILWLNDANIKNISPPTTYTSGQTEFPKINADIVLTINTFHIMSWTNVKNFIIQLGENLKNGARFIVYGPFNYQGKFTSDSNAKFDLWLKQRDILSGIRNFEDIIKYMTAVGIILQNDTSMPANNRLLHFTKNKL